MKKHLILFIALISFLGYAQEETLPDPEPYFIAIIVENLDNSLNWYASALGFEVLNKNESTQINFKQANLKRGSILIELIELGSAVSPQATIPNYNNKTRLTGFFKTGFLIPEFDKWVSRLEALEVEFHGKVVIDAISGKKMVIIKDPDGNRIQLFEK